MTLAKPQGGASLPLCGTTPDVDLTASEGPSKAPMAAPSTDAPSPSTPALRLIPRLATAAANWCPGLPPESWFQATMHLHFGVPTTGGGSAGYLFSEEEEYTPR